MRIVSEAEFAASLRVALTCAPDVELCNFVLGPGRSGALAAVYASHILGIPFLPCGFRLPRGRPLIVDTATESGRTLRKCARRYDDMKPVVVAVYHEPPRVAFWYEAAKPQRYRHEKPLESVKRTRSATYGL